MTGRINGYAGAIADDSESQTGQSIDGLTGLEGNGVGLGQIRTEVEANWFHRTRAPAPGSETFANRCAQGARGLRNVEGFWIAPERIRPSYLPVLRAFVDCIDEGKAPTWINLARKLARSPQAVQQLFARHPDLLPWINSYISPLDASYAGAVVRRCAMLAMQGSADHMNIYFKHQAGGYGQSDGSGDGGASLAGHVVNMNFLCPRPEYPQGALTAAPVTRLPPPNIPPSVAGSQR